MNYKDRCYCPFTECADKECNRRLTEEVRERAAMIGMDIDQYREKPFCFKRGKDD